MAWKIKLGGDKEVELIDLSPADVQAIADTEGVGWWQIVNQHPAVSWGRFTLIVNACAAHAHVESPIGQLRTTRDFIDATEGETSWVAEVQDIEESPMVDGFPPMPDEPESGSSSGASGDSTGLPTSSDDNPSETS